MSETRRAAEILAADIVGYSRLMGARRADGTGGESLAITGENQ